MRVDEDPQGSSSRIIMAAELSPSIPHPSLNKPMVSPKGPPHLYHSLHQRKSSVLSLAADTNRIYSGSQGDDISVWSKRTLKLETTLRGHTGSVLALEYAPEQKWLFSAAGDSTIRVWSTETLEPLFVINPHLDTDAGDLFCLAWNSHLSTLYFGCQNTSIQWLSFASHPPAAHDTPLTSASGTASALSKALQESGNSSGTSTPRRVHKFFDSYPQYERKPADLNARNPTYGSPPAGIFTPSHIQDDPCIPSTTTLQASRILQVPPENMIWSAHYGYVYCMALTPSSQEGSDDTSSAIEDARLVTGSGDATVKVWSVRFSRPTLEYTLDCSQGAVLAVVVRGDTIYAGCQDGYIKVWDLETRTLIRSIIVSEGVDILSLSLLHSNLYSCAANGEVQCWDAAFNITASWFAHSGILLSSIITRMGDTKSNGSIQNDSFVLATGGSDDQIKIWDVCPPKGLVGRSSPLSAAEDGSNLCNDTMVFALSKFVSIPSVSGHSAHKGDCRQAAIWLRKFLDQLGADASLLHTGSSTSPLVLGTFHGNQAKQKKQRILFYGHYDVISAHPSGWDSEPFVLSARNGYLYGRGVTDNKGPIIAAACAVAELNTKRSLDLDIIFLIEGEEESGSGGFVETVKQHKESIGPIDAILVSNSTWIAEDTPCITYGLRGVVHCQVQISNQGPDLHSGVDGGATIEPMMDMVKLLATLTDDAQQVTLLDFYNHVRPLTEEERQLYTVLSGVTQTPAKVLSAKWREPALTVHSVKVSGPTNSTVIPGTVTARVSVRIVPDQDLNTVSQTLQDHLRAGFVKMKSPNNLEVSILRTADWWLGDLDDHWFKALEDAVRDEWGVDPLRIREGGSIPSVPYLEKEFSCHALHLPLGQSTDQAHLPNERMSLTNLRRGKSVVERFLTNVAAREF